MAKNKTVETDESVAAFIDKVPDETKRDDSYALIRLMQQATGSEAKMWGPSIIGFGSYHYKYDSGHEGDAPLIGFSPRSAAISLYLESEFPGKEELIQKLGKSKLGKGCIYVKKLKDVDIAILQEMISRSVAGTKTKYPS